MAEPISIQQLKDASEDAITLADFIYKPANVMIPRRLAADINSLQYYLDYMSSYAQHSYETYDEMVANAANLPNGVSIFVTNDLDGTKNGIYTYNGTSFVKGEYQPENAAKDYVEARLGGLEVFDGKVLDSSVESPSYHPDTYARTQRSIRVDTVSMLDFIPLDLHEGIKSYTYAVDLKAYIQKAIDYCVLNNKKLNVPAGGYLTDSAYVPIYLINHWGADKSCIIEGAGLGLTVFKEADGATNRGGRFTKMLYIQCGLAGFVGDFGHIKVSGITFNKNASGNINDKGLYEYEQAHILALAGVGEVNIKSVDLHDIELIDKIGGGISFSSAPNIFIGKMRCSNILSRKHPKITDGGGDGTFGQRGCIEIATTIGVLDISDVDVIYAQVEPVIPTSPTLRRSTNVNGGMIDYFEWTDKGGYSYANVSNLTSNTKFLVRGINANITNSTLKIKDVFAGGVAKISNSTILLSYNSDTNSITSMQHSAVSGYDGYSELWLSDTVISIDSNDTGILPSGAAITGGTGAKGSRKRFLSNVKFDPRLEQSIDAYGNGDWKVINCDLYGRTFHVGIGGTGTTRGGDVELTNNNYLGTGSKVQVYKNNVLWSAQIIGSYPYTNFYNTTGAADYGDLITTKPTLTSATKPTSGSSPKGQMVVNTNPVAGYYAQWIKMAEAGQTWKGVGLVEDDSVVTSGTTAQRPTGVAVGFTYFDTTLGKPIYFKSTGVWVDSAGVTV